MEDRPKPKFSKTFKASSRTFFFDVYETKDGKPYIKITESRIKDDQKFRNTLMVFKEDFEEFQNTLSEALEKA